MPASASSSAQQEDTVQLFVKNHAAMGTTFSIYLYARNQAEADVETDAAFAEIDRIEELLSNYRETSELSRINRDAFAGPVTTDPETFRFLEASLAWSAKTGGAFDVSVGQLMRTWGFFRSSGKVPTAAELDAVRGSVGWQKIQLTPGSRMVRFLAPKLEIDPGGIGKGYAVERAERLLRAGGVRAALLSAGSSTLYALGAPPKMSGWKVQVPLPGAKKEVVSTLVLRDMSLSTANCSEKHFVADGRDYCHIMDPHTLQPVEGTLQVTVLDPSATASDALSNALFVLGGGGSGAVLHRLPNDAALILSRGNRTCFAFAWTAPISTQQCHTVREGR